MSRKIYPVILSGGSGTRLWPLSRDLLPKQLLALVGEESLMAATARRVSGDGFAGPVIVCNADHKILVQDQLVEIGIAPEAIIIEPVARNTAPAIAAAAALLRERDPDAVMLVLPSDHIIRDLPALSAAIAAAAKAADAGCLVTFGITPTAPETAMAISAAARRSRASTAPIRSPASSRSPTSHRLDLSGRGRLELEQRHVRISGRADAEGTHQFRAGDRRRRANGGGEGRALR